MLVMLLKHLYGLDQTIDGILTVLQAEPKFWHRMALGRIVGSTYRLLP